MATMKNIKNEICDDVYTELEDMKGRIDALRVKLQKAYPMDDKLSEIYSRHLRELSEQIEWKLQIVSHACPHDWKGSVDYDDNSVSVGPPETFEKDFAGGYVGG